MRWPSGGDRRQRRHAAPHQKPPPRGRHRRRHEEAEFLADVEARLGKPLTFAQRQQASRLRKQGRSSAEAADAAARSCSPQTSGSLRRSRLAPNPKYPWKSTLRAAWRPTSTRPWPGATSTGPRSWPGTDPATADRERQFRPPQPGRPRWPCRRAGCRGRPPWLCSYRCLPVCLQPWPAGSGSCPR